MNRNAVSGSALSVRVFLFTLFPFTILGIVGCAQVQRTSPSAATDNTLGSPETVRLGEISPSAEIIYHSGGHLFTMDRNGMNVLQITFGPPRNYEHAAVSYDHRFIVANEHAPENRNLSIVWLYDLKDGTEARVLPSFIEAGDGGVDWDRKGYMYFSGKEKLMVKNPRVPAEFLANAMSLDIYKIKYDGTGLANLTHSADGGENDVSVSEDGTMITYIKGIPDISKSPQGMHTEIWEMKTDGTNPRRVHAGGEARVSSVHDPENSPDNRRVVFSKVNSDVPPNFPLNPDANTAHDIWTVQADGSDPIRLTRPGPISIIPDWKGDTVVYMQISERDSYSGACVVNATGVEQEPLRIKPGAQSPKWIP